MNVLPEGEIVLGINCPLNLGPLAQEAYERFLTGGEVAMGAVAARLTLLEAAQEFKAGNYDALRPNTELATRLGHFGIQTDDVHAAVNAMRSPKLDEYNPEIVGGWFTDTLALLQGGLDGVEGSLAILRRALTPS